MHNLTDEDIRALPRKKFIRLADLLRRRDGTETEEQSWPPGEISS